MKRCSIHNKEIQLHRQKTIFLATAFLLILFLFIKVSQTQTLRIPPSLTKNIPDSDILDLISRIRLIETKIMPMDAELRTLEENHERVTNEVTSLKEQMRKPKGVFDKITGIFGFNERKLRNLMADSQDLSDRITDLQKRRDPLVKNLDMLTTRLIDRLEDKTNILMDVIIKKEPNADKASDQISALLQLARIVTDLRGKYIVEPATQVRTFPFLSSLADDSEKLRLAARLSKNMAQGNRIEAEKKKRELKDLQARKLLYEGMIEKLREIQRSNEEKESSGIESGTAGLAISSNELEIRRKINELKKDIDRLLNEIRDLEEEAKSLENLSKSFEQRASQIESMPRGK